MLTRNTIKGLPIGIQVVGQPSVPGGSINPPPAFKNPLTTIQGNTITLDGFGVFLDGSPSNLVAGNSLSLNSQAGVMVRGTSATRNTIGGASAGAGNTFVNNLNGVFLQDAPGNQVVGNSMTATGPIFTDVSKGLYQVGVYLYGSAGLNTVSGNTILKLQGFGILGLNTPQGSGQANVFVGNTVTDSAITNVLTNATLNPLPANFSLPNPGATTAPTSPKSPIQPGLAVRVSSAYPGRRPSA
jgi:parallel beta-helix repeat protein